MLYTLYTMYNIRNILCLGENNMKKILLLLCSMLCGAYAFAAVNALDIDNALQQAVQPLKMQHSANAHEQGVIPINILVAAQVDSEYADPKPLMKECPVVRISSHYLMGSMACVGLSETATIQHSLGTAGFETTHPEVTRWIQSAEINGQTIGQENIFLSKENKIFLIRIDPANPELRKAVQNKPAVNIFTPLEPQSLQKTFSEVLLNREKLCSSSRTCSEMEIVSVCAENACLRVAWNAKIRGDSGDPLFGMIGENSTEEFLLGFNITDVITSHSSATRQAGRTYSFFDRAQLQKFLQSVMETETPQDWQQVQKKMVSEIYFLN